MFQRGKVDEFDAFVEHGREAVEEFSARIATVFECHVDDLVLVRADSDATEWLCRFATANPDEFVYDVTIGPLLRPDEPFAAGAYISFRIRHDDVDGTIIGRAFDVTVELT